MPPERGPCRRSRIAHAAMAALSGSLSKASSSEVLDGHRHHAQELDHVRAAERAQLASDADERQELAQRSGVDVRRRELIQRAENPGELCRRATNAGHRAASRPSVRESRGGLLGTRVQREPRAVRAATVIETSSGTCVNPSNPPTTERTRGGIQPRVLVERRAKPGRELDGARVAADRRRALEHEHACARASPASSRRRGRSGRRR